MALYFDNIKDPASKPHKLTCACDPVRAEDGWADAGCPFHGIKSNAGKWDDGEVQFDIYRKHVMSRPNGNNRWD